MRGVRQAARAAVLAALAALALAPSAGAYLGEVASWPVRVDDRAPSGLAVAPDGVVYTAAGDRVLAFAADGTPLPPLTAGGALREANGVRATADAVYVTETLRDVVRKLARDGSLLATWGPGRDVDVALDRPHSIAVAGDQVYVVESTAIRVLTVDGAVLGSIPFYGGGEIATGNGVLYVSEPYAARVAILAPDGRRLAELGRRGDSGTRAPGEFSDFGPRGVAVDPRGDVWVASPSDARLQRFSAEGRFETACGAAGARPFRAPDWVVADRDGSLLVLDRYETIRRIADVRPPAATCDTTGPPVSDLAFAPRRPALTRRGRLPRAAALRLRLDEDARLRIRFECVRARRCERPRPATRSAEAGDVRVRLGGVRLVPGAYRVALTATDDAGNRSTARSAPFRVRAAR
jgi:DNA-binding beta-propeller fold protein YncE